LSMAWRTAGRIVALPVYICSTIPLSARALGSVSPVPPPRRPARRWRRWNLETRERSGQQVILINQIRMHHGCCPLLLLFTTDSVTSRQPGKGRLSRWPLWLRTGRLRLNRPGRSRTLKPSQQPRVWSPSLMHSGCCSLLAPQAHGFAGLFFAVNAGQADHAPGEAGARQLTALGLSGSPGRNRVALC
jgi:hypothetical protein